MYKIEPADEPRHCLECGEPLYGRTDKKFCTTACKSKYHGQIRSIHNRLYNSTIQSLDRNYSILGQLFRLKTSTCPMPELLNMGFCPDCVTHCVRKKGKHLEYRCFDFIYNMSSNKLFNLRRL